MKQHTIVRRGGGSNPPGTQPFFHGDEMKMPTEYEYCIDCCKLLNSRRIPGSEDTRAYSQCGLCELKERDKHDTKTYL